jgi:hypothetical protein
VSNFAQLSPREPNIGAVKGVLGSDSYDFFLRRARRGQNCTDLDSGRMYDLRIAGMAISAAIGRL